MYSHLYYFILFSFCSYSHFYFSSSLSLCAFFFSLIALFLPLFLLQSIADHYFDLSYKDRIISFLPMSHIAAQLFDIHVPIYLGNPSTLIQSVSLSVNLSFCRSVGLSVCQAGRQAVNHLFNFLSSLFSNFLSSLPLNSLSSLLPDYLSSLLSNLLVSSLSLSSLFLSCQAVLSISASQML